MERLLFLATIYVAGAKCRSVPENVCCVRKLAKTGFYSVRNGLLLLLDRAGIAASSGSACTSASLEPSLVLLAMGIPHELAGSSLRLTTGPGVSVGDIDYAAEVIGNSVLHLRQ